MRVLSVDWDYFFPDPSWYDWVANEERGMFYELLWSTRANSRDEEGRRAAEHFKPTGHEGFWKRLCPDEPISICVTESHKDIAKWLSNFPGSKDVWNVDAHHDCGYSASQRGKELHCGNWAWRMGRKIRTFHQVYPEWRANAENAEAAPVRKPDSTSFSLDAVPRPHLVFVCRSSCWTPSWYDDKWLAFTGELSGKRAWATRSSCPFVEKAREPNMADAVAMANQMDEFYKMTMNHNMSIENVKALLEKRAVV